MRIVVAGMGVQGKKRKMVAGDDAVATVDPFLEDADYRRMEDVPLKAYDAVLVCTPDEAKIELLTYLLSNGKHVLVEKPLVSDDETDLVRLNALARDKGVACYTAYNHRFEPHFVTIKEAIDIGELGEIYAMRMFYGNGTARLVRDSPWRDKGAGVLPDLGSHLLDTCAFWLGDLREREFRISSASRFENQAFDHVTIVGPGQPLIQLEMTLLSWRNHFTCDIHAEKGSAHISSLCKWGPSTITFRNRVLPSGRPDERSGMLVQADPTWVAEYAHFKRLCETGETNIPTDIWLNRVLAALAREALDANPGLEQAHG